MKDPGHQFLFVYGTLLDPSNECGAWLKQNSSFYEKGMIKGILYDTGEYPAAICNDSCKNWIYGSVLRISKPEEVLKVLDDYEGFGDEFPFPNEFIRHERDIHTSKGLLKCWIYVYNYPPAGMRVISSGDYAEYKKIP